MSARIPTGVGVVVVLLFLPFSVFAVSVRLISVPTIITSDPFTVTASISGAAAGINYLRVDVYKDGTSNYFGETYNGNDWAGGGSGKDYFPITIQTGIPWIGDVQARIGVISSSEYDGQGTYNLRLRRYTSSGNAGSEDANLSAIPIAISIPTPTPTVAPTSVPSHTPTISLTHTASSTNTTIPTPQTPTSRPTSYVRIISRVTIEDEMASFGSVLGQVDEEKRQDATKSMDVLSQKRPYITALLFTGIGLSLLAAATAIKILYTRKE